MQWSDAGGWKVSEIAESKVCSREYYYDRESFKVALYGAESNIQYVDDYRHATHELPNCNGYVLGGKSIGLREVVDFRNYEVYFQNSPTWSATGTLRCRYAAVWIVRESGCDVIASTELGAQDIVIGCGNTLTVDSSTRPLFTSVRVPQPVRSGDPRWVTGERMAGNG
jgi:hypothetical protein